MSAVVTLVITLPNDTVGQANGRIFKIANGASVDDQFTAVRRVINLLEGAELGAYSAQVQITTRDTDPSISTSSTGSIQFTANLK